MSFMLVKRPKVRSGILRTHKREWPRHRRFVRLHDCILAGRPDHVCEGPLVLCHLRKGTDAGKDQRPSDWWTWRGCDGAHKLQHQIGEPAFEKRFAITLKDVCLTFAKASPDVEMKAVMRELGLI
jgi:hypothetical protein